MTIRVSGFAKMEVQYSTDLDMTVDEFEALSQRKQDELIKMHTDWLEVGRSAEVEIDDDLDVVKVVE